MPKNPQTRALIVTCMRDEGPFILEWIAHHKAIGFTDFLIYSNDCSDGTNLMLERLAEMGEIFHQKNERRGKKTVQWQALVDAAEHPVMDEVDWIFSADVDEFLNIRVGDGLLQDLFDAAPDATGFALTWRMFGSGGAVDFVDAPVTEQFTRCAPEQLLWPWSAIQFKCLYRNDGTYEKLGVHRPRKPDERKEKFAVWRDGSGKPLPWHAPGNLTMIPNYSRKYKLAQINHYALGSVENFLMKILRGKPNHSHDSIGLMYWNDRNFDADYDDSILQTKDRSRAIRARYLADETLADLHKAAIKWRLKTIEELKGSAQANILRGQLIAAVPTNVLPKTQQQNLFQRMMQMRKKLRQEKEHLK